MQNGINFQDIDECTKSYMKLIKPYHGLKKKEEHELLSKYKLNNDIESRNKVVTSNLKYTCKLANNFRNKGIPFSHLISEANSALLYAIEKFDMSQNVKLITYAKWWINQRLTDLIEKNNKMQAEDLPTENNDQLLDDNINYAQEYIGELDYENEAFSEEEQTKDVISKNEIVTFLLSQFSERESDIINMKYGRFPYEKEYTLDEIGKKYSMSKERVRQIINSMFKRLRSTVLLHESLMTR